MIIPPNILQPDRSNTYLLQSRHIMCHTYSECETNCGSWIVVEYTLVPASIPVQRATWGAVAVGGNPWVAILPARKSKIFSKCYRCNCLGL